MPVSTFVTATFAPGTDVPAGSDTSPVICPVCANAKPVKPTISSMRCTTRLLSEHQYDGYCHSCQQIITPLADNRSVYFFNSCIPAVPQYGIRVSPRLGIEWYSS